MLTPTLLQPLLAGLSRTLARGTDDPEAAAAFLESLGAETPLQAMLATQAIALHHAAMDCFGRAMETDPEDHATAARLQRNAASLTRAFTATLRTLQRCQAEAARENSMQRETGCGGAWQDGGGGKEFSPGRSGTGAGAETSLNPVDAPLRPSSAPRPAASSQNLMQPEEPAPRRWEDLTEAEQFAILYPERAAAGATSHEDADLWLFNPAVKQPHATWETPTASPRRPGVVAQDAGQPHAP